MAKVSAIVKNNKRKSLVLKYSNKRKELKKIASSATASPRERLNARRELAILPRNSSPHRIRNRCAITGRPRGYIRFFDMSRIVFRELAHKGELPGVWKGNY